jgi:hypothetical protein
MFSLKIALKINIVWTKKLYQAGCIRTVNQKKTDFLWVTYVLGDHLLLSYLKENAHC